MSTFSEPRLAPRARVEQVPQVDVAVSGAAEQLVLTVHIDLRNGASTRPQVPVGFKRAIAAALQGVVDELMPFAVQDVAPTFPEARVGPSHQADQVEAPAVQEAQS